MWLKLKMSRNRKNLMISNSAAERTRTSTGLPPHDPEECTSLLGHLKSSTYESSKLSITHDVLREGHRFH